MCLRKIPGLDSTFWLVCDVPSVKEHLFSQPFFFGGGGGGGGGGGRERN